MSAVLNDRDAILQAATVRIVNPKNAWINLLTSAPGFHVTAAGQADLSVVTVTAELFGLDDAVTFSAVGATLSNAASRTVDVTYGGQTAIVTATVMSNGDKFERSCVIPVLRDGAAGAAGQPVYTWIKYADTAAGAGLSDDPAGKAYIGLAHNKSTATESTTPGDYTWALMKGGDGLPGAKGADGITYYTWIKYADQADGTGLYDTPNANTLYIGIAVNRTTATESTTKTDYVWSRFKGEQGVAGATTYTWIKYADTAAGAGLSDDPSGKAYIGFAYNKATATESTTPGDYTWALIKGTDGQPGGKGADGATLYTWIKYSDNADGTGLYDVPTASTLYIGIATNKSTATESTTKTDYAWSKFRGDQGVPGPTTYTWIKYADTAAGAGLSDDPAGKLYIGLAHNKSSATESTTPSDYTWSLIRGEKGDQGVPGGKGADGQQLYTWIKYSNSANGASPYDVPTDSTLYIGIAVNKTTATESTTPGDYVWSRFRGADGVGTAGARGAGHYYATGSTWSDVVAQAACPGSTPVLNDVVTISSSTYVMEKRWTGSVWVENGVVINGKLIAPDSILTTALAAEIIKAKHLSVGAVLASHISVGPSGGLNKDPNFTDYAGSWSPTNAAVGSAGGAAPAPTYLGAFPGMQAFTLANELIPIDSTKTYLLSASVYADGGNDRNCTLLVNFYDGAGNRITNTGWGDANFSGHATSFRPAVGDWRPYRDGVFGVKSAAKKIPANAKTCRVGVYLNGGGSSNTMMGVTALLLEEMIDSALVVKGGIKADNIDVDRLAAIIAYLGNVELGAGGALRQGKPGYGAGKGIWIGDHNNTPKLDIGETGGAGIIWDGFDLVINRPKLASPFSVTLSNVRITQQVNGSTIQFSAPKTITSGSGSYAYSWSFSASGPSSQLAMISSPAAQDAVIKANASNSWLYGYLALTLKDLNSGLTATSNCEIVVQFGSGVEP
ncbi:hypothetical protein [Massilia brevitalea]|uniref:hypothetical protein n=1 Tax=Massilia brevitalea TaxID=442526 RepID=UPI00273A1875|nr:hypothetical protein [Massilia brevitalea]